MKRLMLVVLAACAAHAPPPPRVAPVRLVSFENGDRYVEQHARPLDRIVSIRLPGDVSIDTVVVLDPDTRLPLHRDYLDTRGGVSRFRIDRDGDILIGYIDPAPPPPVPPYV